MNATKITFLSNLWPESFVHEVSKKFAAAKNGPGCRKFAAPQNCQVSKKFAATKNGQDRYMRKDAPNFFDFLAHLSLRLTR